MNGAEAAHLAIPSSTTTLATMDGGSTARGDILYRNSQGTVYLIDIPTSISAAQGILGQVLVSREPLQQPFKLNDPKSAAARENVLQRSMDPAIHSAYIEAILDALREIKGEYHGDWCLQRKVLQTRQSRKRKLSSFNDDKIGDAHVDSQSSPIPLDESSDHIPEDRERHELPWSVLDSVIKQAGRPSSQLRLNVCVGSIATEKTGREQEQNSEWELDAPGPHSTHSHKNQTGFQSSHENRANLCVSKTVDLGYTNETPAYWDGFFRNTQTSPLQLSITDLFDKSSLQYRFFVPSQATFLLGDCCDSSSFRAAVREQKSLRRFDFILMDPPWPNASARRKNNYSRASSWREMKKLILEMDLETYIAPNGYIAIWSTNSRSGRELVLGPGGIFEQLNVALVEEWIWAKTTVSGEPVSPLDGLWKKPFETLLVAKAPANSLSGAHPPAEVKRRVIFAVPDMHSRKPCLKNLIEEMLPEAKQDSVLEIFARYLVAGWWSWGNEVLKFNWDKCWTAKDSTNHETAPSRQPISE